MDRSGVIMDAIIKSGIWVFRVLSVLTMFMVSVLPVAAGGDGVPSGELRRLDAVLQKADYYDARRQLGIDSLKALLRRGDGDGVGRSRLCVRIADSYRQVNADSSMKYAQRAVSMARHAGDYGCELRGQVSLCAAMATAGLFTSATAAFDSLNSLELDRSIRIELWKTGRMLYSYMIAYVGEDQPFRDNYTMHYMAYDDSLLKSLPRHDPLRRFIKGERLVYERRYSEASAELLTLMKETDIDSNIYGMAAFQMAEVSRSRGERGEYLSYLVKAAVSDIMSGVREGMALSALAELLYSEGRIDDAFRYINFALEGAMSGNARMRTLTAARMLPLIDSSYRREIDISHSKLMAFAISLSVLTVVCVSLLILTWKQIRRARAGERKLASQARIQDSYIGSLLQMCSSYSDRLDQQARVVSRKIKAGQYDELLRMVESGKFSDNQNEEFYRVVDRAILDIYPHFIDSVNSLLREEERIPTGPDRCLTPELRIYAFVRFGVEESTRIARILHYSVATVYTYRNRMRNKAINRQTFDSDVRNI